jgi:uncharacterized protein
MALVAAAEAAVRAALAANDASHDFDHIDRVRKVALTLAAAEGVADAETLVVIELGALLHDLADWKYSGSDSASADAARTVLTDAGASPAVIARVLDIVNGVSFSTELAAGAGAPLPPLEVRLVQDADRLDAIGAVGIARCFTFGGAKHRPLHDPAVPPLGAGLSKEAYRDPARVHTSINHFHEKLLTLKDRMKTPAGAAMAAQRHAFMEAFLAQFLAEWDGKR